MSPDLSLELRSLSPVARDLWVLPLTGEGAAATGIKPRPYLHTRFTESLARFSPEPTPRFVAYRPTSPAGAKCSVSLTPVTLVSSVARRWSR